MTTYIQAISTNYPNVQCHAINDGSVYNDLVWESGDPLPSQAALDVVIVTLKQRSAWLKIQAERDRRKSGGVLVGANWFHSDDTSRIQQLGLVMFGANIPANIMWKTLSGSFVLMTPTLAQQIFGAVAASDMTIFTVAETHKSAMMASSTPETYNYLTGWPLSYGE